MIKAKKLWAAMLLCLSFALLIIPVRSVDGSQGIKITSDRTTDIMILLDCSGTVGNMGLTDECVSAIDTLIDLLPRRGFRAAVAAYGNTWDRGYDFGSDELVHMNDIMGAYARTRVCLAADMTLLSEPDAADSLKSAAAMRLGEERYTHGNNYLGGGLMTALDLLCDSGSDDAAIIILTDGRLSGFDSTDGVEWKSTNRELVDEAVGFAASKGYRIYPIELNADSKNNQTSAARQLMLDIAAKTDGKSFIISSASDLKNAAVDVYADIAGAKVTDSLSVELSPLTSEVSVVLDSNVSSVAVGGKSYSKGTSGAATFTDDVFKLCPASGRLKFTLSGGSALKTVVTERLPLVLSLSHASPMTRNNTLGIEIYLGTSASLDRVSADEFYKSSDLTLKIGSETVETVQSENGLTASYEIKDPGSYEITASLGGETISTVFEAADYGFTVEVGENDSISRGEIVNVKAFLTGTDGKITDQALYNDGEALLTVRRDGTVIDSDLPMKAGEGYYLDYTVGDTGEYTFSVESKADCLGKTGSVDAVKTIDCEDFTLSVDWSEPDGAALQKSDEIKLTAKLLDNDGNIIERSEFIDGAGLCAERDGEIIEKIPLSVIDGVMNAVWRVSRAGELKLRLTLPDGENSSLEFTSVNHSPVLLADRYEGKCQVGSTLEFDIADYIGDADGDPLEVTASDGAPDWRLSDDSKSIIIDAGGHSGNYDFSFGFDDGDESVVLAAKIVVTNEKPVRTSELTLPHFILKAPAFMFFVNYDDQPLSFELDDYFSDPEGLSLTYSLESSTDMASLDGSRLNIDPRGVINERLRLICTDSSGESIVSDLRLVVDEWWTLNLKRVLIVAGIAAVLLVLCAIIIRRESNIGYLRVASAQKGGETLDINEKLNPRRVRLWSLPLSRFILNRVRGAQELVTPTRERGKLTGHLIFGKKVTLKGCTADGFEKNGEIVEKKLPKKIVLRSGESITLVYGELRVTITNRN